MTLSRVYWTLAIVLVIASWVISAVVYPSLPARIPTHWNISGQVDGYGDKSWALFLMPGTMTGMLLLFAFLPALSPRHFEVDSFRETYLFLMVLILVFLGYMHGLMLYAGWSGNVGITRPLVGGMFLMFALMGPPLAKVRRNFYVGVKTPWTLANERVWNDTHKLAAWLFGLGGLAGLVMIALGVPMPVAFVVLLIAALTPVVYSFVHYKALERRGEI
jgi:uncharacterized membrane protein